MLQHTCALKGVTQAVEVTLDEMASDVFVFGRWHNYLSNRKAWPWLMREASPVGASVDGVHREQQSSVATW